MKAILILKYKSIHLPLEPKKRSLIAVFSSAVSTTARCPQVSLHRLSAAQ